MMKLSYWNSCFLVLILLAQAVTFSKTDDTCDSRCQTRTCDQTTGTCTCLPPQTVAANNGKFLGGQFCNQSSHYCNPEISADTFYCVDNNGNTTCGIVNGAYACVCQPGYAGNKCQYAGILCGVGYCYNNATCVNEATCDCPIEWQGNANCTLASPTADSSGGHSIKWWGALLITGAVVAVVSVGAVFGMKKYKERMEGVNRFNELKKSQMRGRAESDDDDEYDSDPYEDEVARNNKRPAPPPPAQQPQP